MGKNAQKLDPKTPAMLAVLVDMQTKNDIAELSVFFGGSSSTVLRAAIARLKRDTPANLGVPRQAPEPKQSRRAALKKRTAKPAK